MDTPVVVEFPLRGEWTAPNTPGKKVPSHGTLSTLEIFDLPRIIVEILTETGLDVHKFKRVLVVSNDVDDFTFFETVSRNRGQKVTLFRNIDEARSWLLGKQSLIV
jgi:hypothetical protein